MKTIITINGVSAEVELTPEQAELFEVKQFGRQRAKQEKAYWYLACCGDIEKSSECNHDYDKRRFERGNYFLSKESAKAHESYTLAVVRVNDKIDQLNKGWKMEWNTDKAFYAIYYSHRIGFQTYGFNTDQHPYLIHGAASEEIAEQIIKEMEVDLKRIFNIT